MGRASGRLAASAGSGPARRSRTEWTDELIEQELRIFTTGRRDWPTQVEFDRAGLGHLAKAVSRRHGAAHWANVLGLTLESRQDKEPFTEAQGVAQAQALIVQLGRLPGANKLRQLGFDRLATAVYHAGGARGFCDKHGLCPPSS
jgi:hypothetical protein